MFIDYRHTSSCLWQVVCDMFGNDWCLPSSGIWQKHHRHHRRLETGRASSEISLVTRFVWNATAKRNLSELHLWQEFPHNIYPLAGSWDQRICETATGTGLSGPGLVVKKHSFMGFLLLSWLLIILWITGNAPPPVSRHVLLCHVSILRCVQRSLADIHIYIYYIFIYINSILYMLFCKGVSVLTTKTENTIELGCMDVYCICDPWWVDRLWEPQYA